MQQLLLAQQHIQLSVGNILKQSSFYQTEAWGNLKQPDFLNQVLIIKTNLSPKKLLAECLAIEKKMGRIRTIKNAPRIIDIDILFYEKLIVDEKDLRIPHPQIQNRRFVLFPLNELSPNFKHPILQQTIHQILLNCTDTLDVKKFSSL